MRFWSSERHRARRQIWLIALGSSAAFIVVLAAVLIPVRNSLTNAMKAEAARAIELRPDLAAEIGDHPQFGFIWNASSEWSPGEGSRAEAYVPVTGSRSSGTLYIEDWDEKLRTVRYRPKGEQEWKDF